VSLKRSSRRPDEVALRRPGSARQGFVSVYGWQTIPGDQTPLAEAAKDVFERHALRDVGVQTEKEHPLYGEAG
jgi:hypothetical protein